MEKEQLRAEISSLVAKYAQLEFAEKIFVPGETVIPPSGKKIGKKHINIEKTR